MIRLLIVVALLSACRGKPPPLDPYAKAKIEIEVLLNERLAQSSRMDALLDQVTITPRRLALIADRSKLYLVGWGGTTTVDGMSAKVDAFEYTPDGLLLVVRGRELAYLDTNGQLQTLFSLPSDGMGLARGAKAMLLFDRTRADGHAAIYELEAGRQARKLLESPQPIDAVAQAGTSIFFATGGVAFEATPGKPLRAVASLPGNVKIRSLAAHGSRLYLSDGDAIYVVEGTRAALVTRGLGGTLHTTDDGLLVLDSRRRMLARVVGLASPDAAAVASLPDAAPASSADGRPADVVSESTDRPGMSRRRKVSLVMGIGGLVAVGTGLWFGRAANRTYDAAISSGHCDASLLCDDVGFTQVNDAHADARIATIATLSGAALLGTATILWLTGKRSPEAAKTAIIPTARNQIGFTLVRRF